MTVCKKFRDGAELHMVVAMSDDQLFQNWYSVIEDDAGIQHPSSTAGYFDSLDQAVAMMKKHRPNAKEVFTMTKHIKKDEGIRLADGRMATLSAAQLPDGKFEVMLFTNGPEMEEVDSIQCEYEETALAHFERLKKYYHTPELKGRYKKLAEDLKEAKAYGLDHAGDDDGGTCNFDSATLYLPRWNKEKVEIAAKTAGVGCSVWTSFTKCCFIFSIPGVGQGFRRTKAAEAMHDFLEERGYDAGMYYQMD